jgi:hypothetical protein
MSKCNSDILLLINMPVSFRSNIILQAGKQTRQYGEPNQISLVKNILFKNYL